MSKNYIKVTFEAWPCELRNSLLIAMQCNICKYCIVVTVICVKYAWHKDGAVLNIDMIQQTCVCSTSKICWFFNDLIHGWLDGRTNAWNDNNTHWHQCWPRVSHLETSAFLTLCHSFPVTCQQMCKNLKMWLADLLTDRQTDKRVAGGHYCWGVLLWPPQLGLGGKCDKKWKFKNVAKITSFSDAATLTFDLRPWKVNQVRTLSLPMCIPNLRTIHPVVFELSR